MTNVVDITNLVDEIKNEDIKSALDILEKGLKEKYSPKFPANSIIEYLISKAEKDEGFSKRINLENKTVKECIKYVEQEVKKLLIEKYGEEGRYGGHLDDDVVYKIAENYFILDDIIIEKPVERIREIPKPKTNKNTTVLTKKEEKKDKGQISLFDF